MLQKGHHSNRDFFVADLPTWSLKDDRASMEHPMFSLAKKPDTAIRRYEHNGGSITIAPGAYGMPTIWDKDVLIYCCSQLIEGIRQGKEPKRDVVFPAYNFLVSTKRSTGKRGYDLVTQALERLAGVRITTNIVTGGMIEDRGFGLIGDWDTSFSLEGHRIAYVEVELAQWLYRGYVQSSCNLFQRHADLHKNINKNKCLSENSLEHIHAVRKSYVFRRCLNTSC